ncbi:hypothetical protein [Nocardia altamirensis]|uniref:hypothetical protein n=1 Tax=Nocardia altamirensis TaxID=472158 RepID=UPI0014354EC0|nr:hypothetical protein [Nocardia altamirensis]
MFDAAQGRWVPAPPATPAGLAPDRSGPAWVYATGPAVLINRHDGTEVRVPQGGSDGADRPWTDARILDNQGRELAHYSEWANGNKTYRLGLNHTVTVGPDNKVIDPKHLDQSPLWDMHDYNRDDGSVTFNPSEVAIDGAVHRLMEIRSRRRITGENWSGTIFQSRLNTERMGQSTLGAALSMSTPPRREEEREDE